MTIQELLDLVVQKDASDLHLVVGSPPTVRVSGTLLFVGSEPLTQQTAENLIFALLTPQQKDQFQVNRELDFGYQYADKGRFRINVYYQRDHPSAALRLIHSIIKTPEELKLPQIVHSFAKLKQGFVLVTGPTGHGKSSTLAAIIEEINRSRAEHIVTIEDPVEYFVKGVNQSQINPEVGLTFATGLRSILRQDPNIIMVGEVRDAETAELVIHAGLTGHLVLTTLHTKDSFGALPRLIDMGIEPFLIASTLNAVSAQRLVRKICASCKETTTVAPELEAQVRHELANIPPFHVRELGLDLTNAGPLTFSRGKGCTRCQQTGYKGRTVISEFLVNTPTLQGIINDGCKIEPVLKEFRRQGMITLKEDGLLRALEGVTSLEEVLRVINE